MRLRFWKSDDYETPPPYFVTDESRDRSSQAWVLALATFLVTLLVLFLLFLSGRWVYRRITADDNKTTTTTTQTTESSDSTPAGTTSVVTPTPTSTPTITPTPTPTVTGTTSGQTGSLPSGGTARGESSTVTLPATGITVQE
jgi:hypothetical protein